MVKFADLTINLDFKNRKAVQRWVESMQKLWDASAGYGEWIQNAAAVSAVAGSRAAAAFSTTFAFVGAEFYLALGTLHAGI